MAKKLLVCVGKSCRKRKAALRRLRSALPDTVELKEVQCQDICAGPVVGLKIDDRWEWFKKLRKDRQLVALRAALRDGEIGVSLKSRRVRSRSGKRR
jgi:hypothetical protein